MSLEEQQEGDRRLVATGERVSMATQPGRLRRTATNPITLSMLIVIHGRLEIRQDFFIMYSTWRVAEP